jgi:hypothetical protein
MNALMLAAGLPPTAWERVSASHFIIWALSESLTIPAAMLSREAYRIAVGNVGDSASIILYIWDSGLSSARYCLSDQSAQIALASTWGINLNDI